MPRWVCNDQGADARDRHQAPRDLVILGATGDLGIELPDLGLQMRECRDQSLQRENGIGRQDTFRILNEGDQL